MIKRPVRKSPSLPYEIIAVNEQTAFVKKSFCEAKLFWISYKQVATCSVLLWVRFHLDPSPIHNEYRQCFMHNEKLSSSALTSGRKYWILLKMVYIITQGCISCGILVSGIRAHGVSSEHIENMEMFSCSPT